MRVYVCVCDEYKPISTHMHRGSDLVRGSAGFFFLLLLPLGRLLLLPNNTVHLMHGRRVYANRMECGVCAVRGVVTVPCIDISCTVDEGDFRY